MPDRTKLRVGDRIRILAVPVADLEQREREIRENVEAAGLTADTIERIITEHPVVTISSIDEYDLAWFEMELVEENGETAFHTLAIMEDESWEHCS